MTTLPYWLFLNRLPGLGPSRLQALLEEVGSVEACFSGEVPSGFLKEWCVQEGVDLDLEEWKGVEADLRWQAAQPCHHILTWEDPRYPPLLKEIAASPFVLFVEGSCAVLREWQLAVVGARDPSWTGAKEAFRFAYALAKKGVVITSGLARGIDGKAHLGALKASGKTIAVLGHGIDKRYPLPHTLLAEQIVSKEGALVTEFPLGAPPKAPHFPRRNRIMSGLARGVLVVEAAVKSGSLITARYALEQGREVFAIPGSIHLPGANGSHHLIRQGAKCVDTIEHILEEWPDFEERAPSCSLIEKELPPL